MDSETARLLRPSRAPAGHKGSFGHLYIVAGSAGMGGAALLASSAAVRIGTGLVTAGVPRCLRDAFLARAPEVMTQAMEGGAATHFDNPQWEGHLQAAQSRSAVALGCGIGRHGDTGEFVNAFARALERPLVVDADGLFHITRETVQGRKGDTVLTPHPGELARLLGWSREEIAADRVAAARCLATDWNAVAVLKGAGTVVAAPGGEACINPTGDQGLATGGTGDVLTGVIAGLLAQGLGALEAALLGSYLHGLARDLTKATRSAASFSAGDLVEGLDGALRHLGAE